MNIHIVGTFPVGFKAPNKIGTNFLTYFNFFLAYKVRYLSFITIHTVGKGKIFGSYEIMRLPNHT
jgi:hypothetical protein